MDELSKLAERFDHRPEIAPDLFSWRDLPADGDMAAFMREMREVWGEQCEYARFTYFNDEYPSPIYPHGLYFEGWSKAPWKHDPPGKEAPFDYPMVAVEGARAQAQRREG